MNNPGLFGYKIGKQTRTMIVEQHASLLWRILVREIYVIMKHYNSDIDKIKQIFEDLTLAKGKPKKETIEKCKIFMDLTTKEQYNCDINTNDWKTILRYCQSSYINVIKSGYFLNNGKELMNKSDLNGHIFMIDFNTNPVTVNFYFKKNGKIYEENKATLDEIMSFDEMPIKSYTEITDEMEEAFNIFYDNLKKIYEEKQKISNIIEKAKELGNEQNIIKQANKLYEDMVWTEKRLHASRRVFYKRLDALNLIEY